MKGMTLSAMTRACNGIYHGDNKFLECEVSSITTDSREVKDGSLFIAIKGARSDGHDYISGCYESGALCCISEHELKDIAQPYIQVESSLQALKDLAMLYRNNLDVKVVGITGSVGKTSTKETIASVLSQKYKVLKTLGNFNNEIGLPLTIFRLQDDDEVAVLEMGISDFGEMSRLAKIARPDICVITNIGLCHLENLKTRDGILKAKTEIFDYMNEDGTVILNGDDDKLITIDSVHNKKPLFFGVGYKNGVYADNYENLGLFGSKCRINNVKTSDGISSFNVNIPVAGSHMVYNALAATVVGSVMGLTSDEIIKGIENLETIKGRNHIIKSDNGLTIIDDCYNANPVSMKASIDVIDTVNGRKVCILGDMFELGANEKQLHFDVGEYLGTKTIDVLIAVGDLSYNIAAGAKDYIDTHYNAYPCNIYYYKTKQEMLKDIGQIITKGDNILVKASHGMQFTEVVEALNNAVLA